MELNLLIFLPSEPELSWQVALKKTKIKLNLLTNISLMVEKSIRSGICMQFLEMSELIKDTL